MNPIDIVGLLRPMDSSFGFRRQTFPSDILAEALASSPESFAVCPQVFVNSWTPLELQERHALYMKAFRKAQRMAAFLPDERIAFP